jgi:hypothetical protein
LAAPAVAAHLTLHAPDFRGVRSPLDYRARGRAIHSSPFQFDSRVPVLVSVYEFSPCVASLKSHLAAQRRWTTVY